MPPQASRRRPEGGDGYAPDGVDRLSDLPEELRLEILGRLGGAREAARTGVLSRLWRGLWTLLPELAFRGVGVGTGSVEAALAQLAGRPAPLDLLDVRVDEHVTPERISSLLSAAARLAPKSLIVAGGYPPRGQDAVVLPCLDRTASLTIRLEQLSLAPPQAGEFAALTSLSLFWSEIDVTALLPLCPWLRVLHLQNCFMVSIDGARRAVVHLPLLEELLLRESFLDYIDIEAPVLKKLKVELIMDNRELSIWFSAPMVERFDWVLVYNEVDVSFGQLWRMNSVREIGIQGYLPRVKIRLRTDPSLSDDDQEDFNKAMAQLPFPNFSVLDLYILAQGHVFGPVVLHLLRIQPAIQMLKISMEENRQPKVDFPCSSNCRCKQPNNWRNESVDLTDLEEINIVGLKGKDHEVDFLKLLLRCATELERMTVRLYDGVSPSEHKKICHVFKEYPDVECVVYRYGR